MGMLFSECSDYESKILVLFTEPLGYNFYLVLGEVARLLEEEDVMIPVLIYSSNGPFCVAVMQ